MQALENKGIQPVETKQIIAVNCGSSPFIPETLWIFCMEIFLLGQIRMTLCCFSNGLGMSWKQHHEDVSQK